MAEQETATGVNEAAFGEGMVTPSELVGDSIAEHGKKKGGKALSYTIYIHPQDGNSNRLCAAVAQYRWEDWNETAAAAALRPGRYFLTARVVGERGFLCTVPFVVGNAGQPTAPPVTNPAPAPAAPQAPQWPGFPGAPYMFAPPAPAAAPGGMSDNVLVAMIQSQSAQNATMMNTLATLMAASNKGPTLTDLLPLVQQRTPIGELMQLLELVQGKIGTGDGGGDDMISKLLASPAIGPIVAKLMQGGVIPQPRTVATVAPVAQLPAKPEIVAEAGTGAGHTPPAPATPAAPVDEIEKMRQQVIGLLKLASSLDKGEHGGDPETYADALLDLMTATGQDAVSLAYLPGEDGKPGKVSTPDGTITDAIIDACPELKDERTYILKVEAEMRGLLKAERDAEGEEA